VSDARQVHLQPAYVLHHRPYRDTSRILELFTRDYGRVSLFARGARSARKAGTALTSILQPFNRLLVSWSGKGEAGQLTGAEFDGTVATLPPERLVSGFYLNELLLKLFARHDSHPDVFALYGATLDALKVDAEGVRPLRLFEKRLLDALGYGLALERDVDADRPLDERHAYRYRLDQGATRIEGVAEGVDIFSGRMLLAVAREDFTDPAVCAEARALLRAALDRCLEGKELRTRQVMLALRKRKPL
jgi:DNA repair protein RecO (recombination protein O)